MVRINKRAIKLRFHGQAASRLMWVLLLALYKILGGCGIKINQYPSLIIYVGIAIGLGLSTRRQAIINALWAVTAAHHFVY